MSRVGKRELLLPEGVKAEIKDNNITITGKKGTLSLDYDKVIKVEEKDSKIIVSRINEIKHSKQLHGTTNALINNMIVGVTDGFEKELEINGVGYRFNVSGKLLTINAGYSHPIKMEIPEGLSASVENNTELKIQGIDKQKVTEFAANVRKVRKPEPYKGKGIRYKDEIIRRKEGKKAV